VVGAVKGDPIPSLHHLALHCQPTSIEVDKEGQPTGIGTDALRVDDDGISTNWIEYCGGTFETVCALLKTLRTVRRTHRVGVLQVKEVEGVGTAHAVHDPVEGSRPNPGHALIVGVKPDDVKTLRAIAVLFELRQFV
jgi:hypothetical protein